MRSILWWLVLGVLLVSNVVTAMFSGVNPKQQEGGAMQVNVNRGLQPQRTSPAAEPVFSEHYQGRDGVDLGGVYEREGLRIHWAGSEPLDARVRPKDVIRATIERLEAEQRTNLGSDSGARAMVLLMEAKAILEGTLFDSSHGPVIE